MSEDVIQHFREVLVEDIVFAEGKLKAAINLPVDDYAAGEIYLTQVQAKRQSIRDAEFKLEKLKKLFRECFPSSDYVKGEAEIYMWKKVERKIT